MATKKPKVGDPAIIAGMPAVIAIIEGDTVEFHDDDRVAAVAQAKTILALPHEEQRMARAEFAMNPTPPSGTRTWALKKQVFWVEYSKCWSCFGRLLSRTPDRDDESTVRSRAKLIREADQPYDPANEIAHHIIHEGAV